MTTDGKHLTSPLGEPSLISIDQGGRKSRDHLSPSQHLRNRRRNEKRGIPKCLSVRYIQPQTLGFPSFTSIDSMEWKINLASIHA
jgi:hypothetical protein